VWIKNACNKCASCGSLRIQDAKNRYLGTIAQLCPALSLQLRHVSTTGKKLVKTAISPPRLRNIVNFGPLGAAQQISTGFASWLHCCTDVAHRRPTKLCTIFGCLLGWYTIYIHFWGPLPPNIILPAAKFSLRPSLAFSYIGSITAQHSSSGHQPNFVAWYIVSDIAVFVLKRDVKLQLTN